MECRWIFVIGVIALNIYKVQCDMIDIEPAPVDADNKLVIENSEVKDRHDMSLFPKMTKKFVVTLAPPTRPRSEFRVTSKRRLLPQFVLKQRANDRPVSNKLIITRQPIMKRRKFTVKPRTLNLSVNINNMNRKNPILINNQHKLKVKNNISDIVTSTIRTHDKDSSQEFIEDKNSQNYTSKESNEMFQTDTFGVFGKEKSGISSNLKNESKYVKSSNEKEFDVSHEVNTLSSVFSEESNSNENIQKTSADEKNKKYDETKEIFNKETPKVDKLSTNNNEYIAEEDADRNEFLFTGSHIKNTKPHVSKKVDATKTEHTRNLMSSRRLERSINVIEEEHLATASSFFHSTGRDPLFDLSYVYKNIHT